MVARKTPSEAVTGQAPVKNSNAEIREDLSGELLGIIKDLAVEVRPNLRRGLEVELDSDLDTDIGLDSLARAELVLRLDRAFKARLPERLIAEAATPRDLLEAVAAATPRDELGRHRGAKRKAP
ncbi:MAG: hypothetical protein DRQ37_08355, partial [Gammaproteobacteria bacterium]